MMSMSNTISQTSIVGGGGGGGFAKSTSSSVVSSSSPPSTSSLSSGFHRPQHIPIVQQNALRFDVTFREEEERTGSKICRGKLELEKDHVVWFKEGEEKRDVKRTSASDILSLDVNPAKRRIRWTIFNGTPPPLSINNRSTSPRYLNYKNLVCIREFGLIAPKEHGRNDVSGMIEALQKWWSKRAKKNPHAVAYKNASIVKERIRRIRASILRRDIKTYNLHKLLVCNAPAMDASKWDEPPTMTDDEFWKYRPRHDVGSTFTSTSNAISKIARWSSSFSFGADDGDDSPLTSGGAEAVGFSNADVYDDVVRVDPEYAFRKKDQLLRFHIDRHKVRQLLAIDKVTRAKYVKATREIFRKRGGAGHFATLTNGHVATPRKRGGPATISSPRSVAKRSTPRSPGTRRRQRSNSVGSDGGRGGTGDTATTTRGIGGGLSSMHSSLLGQTSSAALASTEMIVDNRRIRAFPDCESRRAFWKKHFKNRCEKQIVEWPPRTRVVRRAKQLRDERLEKIAQVVAKRPFGGSVDIISTAFDADTVMRQGRWLVIDDVGRYHRPLREHAGMFVHRPFGALVQFENELFQNKELRNRARRLDNLFAYLNHHGDVVLGDSDSGGVSTATMGRRRRRRGGTTTRAPTRDRDQRWEDQEERDAYAMATRRFGSKLWNLSNDHPLKHVAVAGQVRKLRNANAIAAEGDDAEVRPPSAKRMKGERTTKVKQSPSRSKRRRVGWSSKVRDAFFRRGDPTTLFGNLPSDHHRTQATRLSKETKSLNDELERLKSKLTLVVQDLLRIVSDRDWRYEIANAAYCNDEDEEDEEDAVMYNDENEGRKRMNPDSLYMRIQRKLDWVKKKMTDITIRKNERLGKEPRDSPLPDFEMLSVQYVLLRSKLEKG